MRRNLYIIGARGFGREVVSFLPMWPGFADRYEIKGFLDDNAQALDDFSGYPPVVSSVEDFKPGENDVFVCALGAVEWRRKYIGIGLEKGFRFPSFICAETVIFPTAKIGEGVLSCGKTVISADVDIGDHTLIHGNCTLGHDVKVGAYSVLENGVFCGGGSEVGEGVTIHTRATVLPHLRLGDGAMVGACSCVARNVKPGVTVFGNPAQPII